MSLPKKLQPVRLYTTGFTYCAPDALGACADAGHLLKVFVDKKWKCFMTKSCPMEMLMEVLY